MSQAALVLYSQPPMERTPKSPAGSGAKSCHGGEKGAMYQEGAEVEVRIDDDGFRGAWYEATIVGRISQRRCQVVYASLVEEHDPSQPLSEVVRSSDIRPRPPPPPCPSPATAGAGFGLHDLVEGFHNDGWWAGVISAVIHGGETVRYLVSFPTSREEVEFEASKLRYHLHWVHAQWLTSSELGAEEAAFAVGAHVQVSRQGEDLCTVWFDAYVIKVLNSSTFLVEYDSLISEKNGGLLTEIVDYVYIRSFQSIALQLKNVSANDTVEVLHHGGWVLGEISKVLNGSSYIVKICHDGSERKFDLTELRHSQYWDGKKWAVKFQKKTTKSPARAVSNQRNSQNQKRGRPCKLASTSSDDDGEIICERGSFKLKPKHKKAAVRLESSPSCKNSKNGQLLKYRLKRRLLLGGNATIMSGINFCASVPTVEHNSREHHSENPSSGKVVALSNSGRTLTSKKLSSKILSMPNMNGLAEIPIMEEPPQDIHEWRSYGLLDGLPSFITKKRTKIGTRNSNDNEVQHQAQDETNETSIENHMTNFSSKFSTSLSGIPSKFKNSEKSNKEVMLSNCSRDKDESSGHDLYRDRSLPPGQESNASSVQGTPSIVDIVANPQVTNAISIYRVSKQLDHGHFSYIAPLKERLTAKNLTIEFLMAQPYPDIILNPVETDACREISGSITDSQNRPSVLAKDCAQTNQHDASTVALVSENESGALNDPSPPSVASPLMEVQLPFQKTSSMWELIESMEAFKVVKQQPHFQALELYSTDFREGMAIGLMVSFANIFTSIQEANMDEAVNTDEAQASLIGKLNALGPLEANGFDVGTLRCRLQVLLEMLANRKECKTRKAELEEKILVQKANNDRLDFLASAFNRSIEELEQNLSSLRERRDLVTAQISHNQADIFQTGKECS